MKFSVRYAITSPTSGCFFTLRADFKKLLSYLAERGVAVYKERCGYIDPGGEEKYEDHWLTERSFYIDYDSLAHRTRVELIMSGCQCTCKLRSNIV